MEFAAALALMLLSQQPVTDGTWLAPVYRNEVTRRLDPPLDEQHYYADLALKLLIDDPLPAQYILIVDRNKNVQAIFTYWISPARQAHFIGASPVSTGKPGRFDYFTTPTGVFAHTLDNPDFRAEGTPNENGIRGYGSKGMRVFDFGWQTGERGWGRGGTSLLRLLLHATDPDLLESRLGTPQSKGCIRIPATLNVFLDHYGILDAEYDRHLHEGRSLWILSATRQPTPWSGRYLVVVDSGRTTRPAWALPTKAPIK